MVHVRILAASALVLAAAALIWAASPTAPYAEATRIAEGARDFEELSERFKKLATDKGAPYAFDVLLRAKLPLDTDLHLLGHAIGDELYRQQGVEGIAHCTQDFRNACSHSIVIGALNEYGGHAALERVREACGMAPGGPGAYTMCYHGLGHGILAYFGYDLVPTIAMCKRTGTEAYRDREYIECVGGAIMELMGGGGHDREAWQSARDSYLREGDPLSPCSGDLVPKDAKGMCYNYLTPHLFGGDRGNPGEEEFRRAFALCDTLTEEIERHDCFKGIGKEFPALALDRDIRSVGESGVEALALMRRWCAMAPHAAAAETCADSVLDSLFWGGENDSGASVRFCALESGNERTRCFEYLFFLADTYVTGSERRRALCAAMPFDVTESCARHLTTGEF